MRIFRLLAASALLLLLWGCASVTSSALVGEEPVSLDEREWVGTWLGPEGTVKLEVVDAKQGRLRAAWIEGDGDKLKMEVWQVQIRSSGTWVFANIKDDDQDVERYWFSRVKRDRNQILFWAPNPDAFKAAVEAGHLPGEVSDSDVHLPAMNADLLEVIMSEQEPALFNWVEPVVFVRLNR